MDIERRQAHGWAHIIANPIAGKGTSGRVRPPLEEGLRRAGYDVRYVETGARGDAEAEARRSAGAAVVVAIGGDGTINEVLNGLPLPGGPTMAVVPAGTANVLAKELGIPRPAPAVERIAESVARLLSPDARRPERLRRPSASEAARIDWIAPALAAGRVRRIDVGVANGRRFAAMAGAGFDARVVRILDAARRGPIRMSQYPRWTFEAILGYAPPRIGVVVDGREIADDASFVIVASSASYGGPLTFAPGARPDDGRFEVAAFRGRGIDDLVRWLTAAWLGRPDRDPLCRLAAGREVRLESRETVDLQVDGDPAGTLPVTCAIMPDALAVLVPNDDLAGRVAAGSPGSRSRA